MGKAITISKEALSAAERILNFDNTVINEESINSTKLQNLYPILSMGSEVEKKMNLRTSSEISVGKNSEVPTNVKNSKVDVHINYMGNISKNNIITKKNYHL